MKKIGIGSKLNQYLITENIGAGGMGDVYKAFDEKLKRNVAIKVFKPLDDRENVWQTRFISEARTLAQLNSPYISQIYDIEENHDPIFIAMEYLEGESLKEFMQKSEFTIKEFIKIFKELARAFQLAHDKGIVHRDIKPANIFICKNGEVKILDFGIAKWEGDIASIQTQQNEFLGSIQYCAPEAINEMDVSFKSDIYSLGMTLYFTLMKSPPFDLTSVDKMLKFVTEKEPKFSDKVLENYPEEVVSLIYEMIEKHPADRPASMNEIIARLEKTELPSKKSNVSETTCAFVADVPETKSGLKFMYFALVGMMFIAVSLVSINVLTNEELSQKRQQNNKSVNSEKRKLISQINTVLLDLKERKFYDRMSTLVELIDECEQKNISTPGLNKQLEKILAEARNKDRTQLVKNMFLTRTLLLKKIEKHDNK